MKLESHFRSVGNRENESGLLAPSLNGDGLVSSDVTGAVKQTPQGGQALVTNTGVIKATGGTVELTAASADGIVQNLVRAGGHIQANTDASTGTTGHVLLKARAAR